jgi:hypothetical protein
MLFSINFFSKYKIYGWREKTKKTYDRGAVGTLGISETKSKRNA